MFFTGQPIAISTHPSVEDLEKILEHYGPPMFAKQFGTSYLADRTKPNDIAADSKLFSTMDLCYIHDTNPDILSSIIDTQILEYYSAL
jgi:hypothetical protein